MTIYPYARHSDAQLTERLTTLETTPAEWLEKMPRAHLEHDLEQIELIKAEIKFRSQRGAVEALVTYHYDQIHDERRGTAQHWVAAIEAMRADLLALDVPAELVERHVSLMRQMVGVGYTSAAPSVTSFLSEHH